MKIETEQNIVNTILEYLKFRGYFAWRNNTGGFKNAKGGFYRFGLKGSSDIFAIQKNTGRFVAIECKRKGNKLTSDQGAFIESVITSGGIAIIAHSLEDVINSLERKEGGV